MPRGVASWEVDGGSGTEFVATAGVRWGIGGEVEVGTGGRGMSTRPTPLLASVGTGGRGISGLHCPGFPVQQQIHTFYMYNVHVRTYSLHTCTCTCT